jgi:hypothetical protein
VIHSGGGRMRRRFTVARAARAAIVALAASVAAATLVACSQPLDAQVAIRSVDGEIELLMRPCRDDRVGDIIVSETTAATDRAGWHISGGDNAPVLSSVRLFSSPAGWIMAWDTLTELEPDVRYDASIRAGGIKSEIRGFTLADIAALADGQVLGVKDGAGHGGAMSMDEFAMAAGAPCSA